VINCKDSNTDYRVFAQLAAAVGEEVPNTGLPTEEVFKRFKDHLDTERQTMIVVLDEIDRLIKKPTTESSPTLLHRLTCINTELQKAQVCLIGIINDLKPEAYSSSYGLSILAGEKIVFHPYQAAGIRDILQQRAALAFYAEAIDSSALEHTMVLAAQPYGDVCVAINLLRVAGELAEKESAKKVTKMHVQHAQSLLGQEE
jgi:cell division control protein 6